MFNNTENQIQDEQTPAQKPAEHQTNDSGAKVIEPPQKDEPKASQPAEEQQTSQITQEAIEEQIAGLSVPKPSGDDSAAPGSATTAPEPAAAPPEEPKAEETHDRPAQSSAPAAKPDELLALKQEALEQLSPIVPHLDQNPEERFRTLMMMIQASDDHTKIKDAYQAAKKIEDDKVRAQALLDVINEINYFTQNKQQDQK